jgi:hypothetical protein
MDQGNITGCTTTSCPEAFPVSAAAVDGLPVTCLSTRSQCSDVSGNYVFALFKAGTPSAGGLPTSVLDRCIPNPAGLSTCDGMTGYTGLELYNSLGALVGCTTTGVTACPPQFPFAFYDAAGALNSCRANITGSCGAATGNAFPTPIFDDKVGTTYNAGNCNNPVLCDCLLCEVVCRRVRRMQCVCALAGIDCRQCSTAFPALYPLHQTFTVPESGILQVIRIQPCTVQQPSVLHTRTQLNLLLRLTPCAFAV